MAIELNIKWDQLKWTYVHNTNSYYLRGYLCQLYSGCNIDSISERIAEVKKKNDDRWEWTRKNLQAFHKVERKKPYQGIHDELEEAKFRAIEDLVTLTPEQRLHLAIRRDIPNLVNYQMLADYYSLQGDLDRAAYLMELIKWIPFVYNYKNKGNLYGPPRDIRPLIDLGTKIKLYCFTYPDIFGGQRSCIHRHQTINPGMGERVNDGNEFFNIARELDFDRGINIDLAMQYFCQCVGLDPIWFKSHPIWV